MRRVGRRLLTVCEALGVGAALLVLPCALVDRLFGTDLIGVLSGGILVVLACAAILSVASLRES